MPNSDGYTPEGLEDAKRETYMELLEIFRPIMIANLRRKIEQDVTATSFSDEDMREYCMAVRELAIERYGSEEIADRHMREAARRFVSVEAVPPEARPPMLCNDETLDEALDLFVVVWLDELQRLVTGEEGNWILDASLLGLDMLPETLTECDHCGSHVFHWTPYSETQARALLRFVRSSLGNGKVLPDMAIKLLSLHGVTVINLA